MCPSTQNYTEKKFELNATAITTPTHNVVGLEKLSHSSRSKQAAQSLRNLSSHALFSGTKVCSSTPGPPGWPWLSVSPFCSNFNVFSEWEPGGNTEQRVTRQQTKDTKKIDLDLFLHPGDSLRQQETKAGRPNYRTAV